MSDFVSDPTPGPLDGRYLEWLRELVAAMQQPVRPRGESHSDEDLRSRRLSMLTLSSGELEYAAMLWLYDSNRIFNFDWMGWSERHEIFANWTHRSAASLDHLTVRKLITAEAREDRWSEDSWEGFFKNGRGQALFARLLELEEELAAGKSSQDRSL